MQTEDEIFENESLESDEESLYEIQEEYRRKRLIESLIGPIVSTAFHVTLVIILALFWVAQYEDKPVEIVVEMEEEIEDVIIEEPPPIEEPEPVEEQEDVVNPNITTVAVENVDTDDASLEDVNDDAPQTDDNLNDDKVSDIVVSPSALASASVYGGRSSAGRASSVSRYGGGKKGQAKLMKALWWLAKVQNVDGSWGTAAQPAMTGLALLTFLAHGETPDSKNFGTTVKKAMKWLSADNSKGDSHEYSHAIRAYALAEAYAMTGVYELEEAMNRNIERIIKGQMASGSFNYNYSKGDRADLSYAGWNFQALKAAQGAGCELPGLTEAIYKAVAHLKKHGGGGSFYYSTNGDAVSGRAAGGRHTMRAVGTLCLQLFGEGDSPEIQDDIRVIATGDLQNLSWGNAPKESLYGWYYATQAMFQAGGQNWGPWNRRFQKVIGDNQNPEGYWEYPGVFHGPKGDVTTQRVYATTLCGLMLTVYYRYLPSSKGAKGEVKTAVKKKEEEVKEEELDLTEEEVKEEELDLTEEEL